MRRIFWYGIFVISLVVFSTLPVFAGSVPLDVRPASLELKGAPSTALTANLRFYAVEESLNLSAGVSELSCADEDGQSLPGISASQVVFTPVFVEKMTAGSSTQITVSFTLPEKTGTCTGNLFFNLGHPIEYQVQVPVHLVIATTPVLALQSPEKIIVNGWNSKVLFSQPFTLKETAGGSPVTDLSGEVGLFSNAEWKAPPGVGAVKVNLAATTLPGGQTLTGSVDFNLADVSAGTYEGQILFKSAGELLASLPLTLNVRHPRWPGVAALAVGVALGLWISFYKEKGRSRDQLIRQIAEVKKKRDTDPELIEFFGPSIDPLIKTAESLLSQKKYAEGIIKISAAEQLVAKWANYDRLEWIAQLDYLKNNLLPRLTVGKAPFIGNLLERANMNLNEAAEQASPAAVQKAIHEIEELLAGWKADHERIEQISSAIQLLPSGQDKDDCLLEEKDLRLRHSDLPLDKNHVKWTVLDGDIQKLLQKVIHISNNLKTPLVHLLGASWNIPPMVLASAPPKLAFHQPVTEKEGKAAQRRLTFWTVLTYALGGSLLAVAGYGALCLPNLTFGAHPVLDYAGLFVWGLSGQAGFTTIADLVRGFGLPAFLKGG
jgi:hypothetical protein